MNLLEGSNSVPLRPGSEPVPSDEPGPWWPAHRRLVGYAMASVLVVAGLGGASLFWLGRAAGPQEYVEIYLTDLPANMTALELHVDGVYVGERNHSLHLEAPIFDLLALQGPGESLLVAGGFVPAGNHSSVRIVFAGAVATIDGVEVEISIPEAMLTVNHASDTSDISSSAFLFDIDAEQSIVATASGLEFRPTVSAYYHQEYDTMPERAPDGGADSSFEASRDPSFETQPSQEPSYQSRDAPSAEMSPGGSSGDGSSPDPEPPSGSNNSTLPDTGDVLPDLGGGTGTGNETPVDDLLDEIGLIVQYTQADLGMVTEGLTSMGLSFSHFFPGQAAGYLLADAGLMDEIAAIEGVLYVEREVPVSLTLDSSRTAIRSGSVTDPILGLRDSAGRTIDGRGVGVAVIDSGVDATHSDLPYNDGIRQSYTVVANYKVESVSLELNLVSVPNSDTTSGHGTHVAGIIAGQGTFDLAYRGVAPGAQIYGFGIGESSTTLWTNQALAWVLENHDTVSPPIRVVSNSWSTGTSYDPNALSSRLVRDLVAEGVVVIFAAGNNGGAGGAIQTSAEGQNPAEGVVSVANYDDMGDGRRTGPLSSTSSRGAQTAPSSWPDLSAPGTVIMSTKTVFGLQTGLGLVSHYTELSGTSMAAPHVSGVVALMLQADPSLSPAQVESILESSAYEFSDGGSYSTSSDARYNGSHYAKGHGLLDAYGAVQAALA